MAHAVRKGEGRLDENHSSRSLGPFEILRTLETTKTTERLLARQSGPDGFQRLVLLKRFLAEKGAEQAGGAQGDARSSVAAREASAYALLGHPAAIRLYQFLVLEDRPTLVLEYVDGLSLAEVRAAEVDLSDASAAAIASAVFGVLAAAHDARNPETAEFCPLVHGALSSASVQIAWTGDVKLGDFRVASPIAHGRSEPPPSPSFFERDPYTAPEQTHGEPPTVRTDVFRACVLAYELFARPSVFPGRPGLIDLVRDPAQSLAMRRPDLPRAMVDAITRGLERSVERRNVSAAEIAQEIAEAMPTARGHRELSIGMKELRRAALRRSADPLSYDEKTVIVHRDALTAMGAAVRTPEETTAVHDRSRLRADPWRSNTAQVNTAQADAALADTAERPTVKVLPEPVQNAEGDRGSDEPFAPLPHTSWPVALPLSMGPIPSRPKRRVVYAVAGGALVACGLVAIVMTSFSRPPARRAATAAAAAGMTVEAPRASATQEIPTSEDASTAPDLTGIIEMPPWASQHRIFVDGALVGSGTTRLTVPCGIHIVRLGSASTEQRVDVPCGGAVSVPMR
jgi:hypothetical protein